MTDSTHIATIHKPRHGASAADDQMLAINAPGQSPTRAPGVVYVSRFIPSQLPRSSSSEAAKGNGDGLLSFSANNNTASNTAVMSAV
jgi:hypothetical protein